MCVPPILPPRALAQADIRAPVMFVVSARVCTETGSICLLQEGLTEQSTDADTEAALTACEEPDEESVEADKKSGVTQLAASLALATASAIAAQM